MKPLFDYILLDCPAGIQQGFRNAIAAADQAVVVTTPEVSAIRDADRIIGLLEADGIKKIDLILNRIRIDMVRRGEMMSTEDVLDILAVNLLGAVLGDEESVVIAANHGESLIGSNTLAGQAFLNIARRLDGETVPLLDLQTSTSLFQKSLRFRIQRQAKSVKQIHSLSLHAMKAMELPDSFKCRRAA